MIWGSGWDPLIAQDDEGLLVKRMGEIVDGQYQKYTVSDGKYQQDHFFGVHPKLMEMSRLLTDEHVRTIIRGGHDQEKIYAAYKAAVEHPGAPTVILAKTIKGYGWANGRGQEHRPPAEMIDEDGLRHLRTELGIPLSMTRSVKRLISGRRRTAPRWSTSGNAAKPSAATSPGATS